MPKKKKRSRVLAADPTAETLAKRACENVRARACKIEWPSERQAWCSSCAYNEAVRQLAAARKALTQARQKNIDHQTAARDVINESRLFQLRAEAAEAALAQEKAHVEVLNKAIGEYVEAGSVFQHGGELHADANLRLGASCVVDGLKWIIGEYKRQKAQLTALQAELKIADDCYRVQGEELLRHIRQVEALQAERDGLLQEVGNLQLALSDLQAEQAQWQRERAILRSIRYDPLALTEEQLAALTAQQDGSLPTRQPKP